MFTRYAKVEVQEILEVKGSPYQIKTANLTHMGGYEDYRTEDGYLYARIRAISSRVNKNHDAWPSVELAGDHSLMRDSRISSGTGFTVEANQDNRYGFSSFLGKPIFVDHNNTNPKRARGDLVCARLHVEPGTHDPYYKTADCHPSFKPATWVELLLEIDAKTFPRLAKAIIDGSRNPHQGIDGFSMGANVERSICSHCANVATAPDEFCKHIASKGAYWDYKDPETGHKTSRRSFEFCEGVQFFEISAVFDPADETALIREVRASVEKEADVLPGPPPGQGAVPDPVRPQDTEVADLAMEYQMKGIDPATAMDMAIRKLQGDLPGHGEGASSEQIKPYNYTEMPPGGVLPEQHNDPRWSSNKE